MNRKISLSIGFLLIAMGLAALGLILILPILGLASWPSAAWRVWPLLVMGVGVFLGLLPFLAPEHPWLGGLLILSLPILATGGILLFDSFANTWHIWRYAWPLELLVLVLGCILAAWRIHAAGLLVPAIIGLNGLLFQFCALTGWWGAWAVLWTLEPLAVGLALLALNLKLHKRGLFLAGIILCALAAIGLVGMPLLLTTYLWVNILGPLLLVGLGVILLINTMRPRRESASM